jgi:hypothetical protein
MADGLHVPRPLAVTASDGPDGTVPQSVVWRGRRRPVAQIEEVWLIEDEWWREPIRRRYFAVTLADGRRLTLFHDLRQDTWWEQSY